MSNSEQHQEPQELSNHLHREDVRRQSEYILDLTRRTTSAYLEDTSDHVTNKYPDDTDTTKETQKPTCAPNPAQLALGTTQVLHLTRATTTATGSSTLVGSAKSDVY